MNDISINSSVMKWTLEEHTLTIAGKGKMADYDTNHFPKPEWECLKDDIFRVVIREGVTEIGINSFKGCKNLKKVLLPDSLHRIHSGAFKGCIQLSDIQSFKKFRFIHDKGVNNEENSILFGCETFSGTPWQQRFGDFYIRNHILYFTITNSKQILVPEGVKVLKSFALSNLDVESITLPRSLEVIEDFAFFKTKVKEIIEIPVSVHTVSEYALHDSYALWKGSSLVEKVVRQYEPDARTPKIWEPYSVHFINRKAYGPFKQLKVVKGTPPESVDQNGPTLILEDNVITDAMCHSKSKRDVLICISCNDKNEIISVESYLFVGSLHAVMHSILTLFTENGVLTGYNIQTEIPNNPLDTFNPFKEEYGAKCLDNGSISAMNDGIKEIWFLYLGNYAEIGSVEYDLTKRFLKENADFSIGGK